MTKTGTGKRVDIAHPQDTPEVLEVLAAFIMEVPRTGGQSKLTMDTYQVHVRSFLRYLVEVRSQLHLSSLTNDDVVGFLAAAKEKGNAANTRTTKLMSIRCLGAWMVDTGRHPGPPLGEAVKPPRLDSPPRKPYRPQDANLFLDTAWLEAKDLRRTVAAHIVALGFGSGLRPFELLGLQQSKVDLDNQKIEVIGKGKKHRTVILSADTTELLRRYMADIRPRLVPSDYVFVNPKSLGSKWIGRYGDSAFQLYFKRIGQLTGLPGEHFPHRLRHTYATDSLRRGLSTTVLQKQLGHSNLLTTTIYVHLVDDDVENAVRTIHGERPRTTPPRIRILPAHYRSPELIEIDSVTHASNLTPVIDSMAAEGRTLTDRSAAVAGAPGNTCEPTHETPSIKSSVAVIPDSPEESAARVLAVRCFSRESPDCLRDIPPELRWLAIDALINIAATCLTAFVRTPHARNVINNLIDYVMETVRESVQSKCSEETEHLALIAASRAGGIPAPLARPFPCDEEHYLLLSWTLAKGSAILDDH